MIGADNSLLHLIAWASLTLCGVCALSIAFDEIRRPQKMWIMNIVWPVTALYFGPVSVWMYRRTLPLTKQGAAMPPEDLKEKMMKAEPTREQVAASVFHCGGGCTIGDIIGETALFAAGGAVFVAGSEFATKIVVDFALAFGLGVVFQYFTIVPMRGLGVAEGIKAAVKADTISITAFEVGMVIWMAFTRFVLFRGHPPQTNTAIYWFMMQIAMIVGFFTSYPANVWLIRRGLKEKMPQYPSMEARERHKLPNAA